MDFLIYFYFAASLAFWLWITIVAFRHNPRWGVASLIGFYPGALIFTAVKIKEYPSLLLPGLLLVFFTAILTVGAASGGDNPLVEVFGRLAPTLMVLLILLLMGSWFFAMGIAFCENLGWGLACLCGGPLITILFAALHHHKYPLLKYLGSFLAVGMAIGLLISVIS